MVNLLASQRTIWLTLQHEDRQATVEIIDNGAGFPAESRKQIFDTFYTSKSCRMGMGLTICNDTIKSHFGTISSENAPNKGALVRFALPRSQETADEQQGGNSEH